MTEPVKYRDIPAAFHSNNKSHNVALLIVRAIDCRLPGRCGSCPLAGGLVVSCCRLRVLVFVLPVGVLSVGEFVGGMG